MPCLSAFLTMNLQQQLSLHAENPNCKPLYMEGQVLHLGCESGIVQQHRDTVDFCTDSL